MTRARRCSISCAVLIAALASAAPADATPRWLGSIRVAADPSDTSDLRTAMLGDGTLLVAWRQQADEEPGEVYVRVRPPVGPAEGYGEGALLSEPDVDGTGVSLAAAGSHAVVAWVEAGEVRTAALQPDGTVGTVRTFAAPDEAPAAPDVAVLPSGDAVVVWTATAGDLSVVHYGLRLLSGAVSDVRTLESGSAALSGARVAAGAAGDATAVWRSITEPPVPVGLPTTTAVRSATLAPGAGAFAQARNVVTSTASDNPLAPTGTLLEAPAVAIDAAGTSLVAWMSRELEASAHVVGAAAAPRGAGFGAPQPVFNEGVDPDTPPRAAPVGTGFAVVARAEDQVVARLGSPGAMEAITPLSGEDDVALEPAVASNARGDLLVVWRLDASPQRLQSIARRGGVFGAVEEVAGAATRVPAVALDDDGNGAAGFRVPGGDLRVAGYDVSGPRLAGISVPTSNIYVRRLAPFAVVPYDVWSSVEASHWDFGDGGGADGTRVTHAWRAQGRYPVTVFSRDALGNVSRAVASEANVRLTPTPGGPEDDVPPVVTAFRLVRDVFRVDSRPASLNASRIARGTAFKFFVSETVRVTIAINRITGSGRTVRKGVLRRRVPVGETRIDFNGRLGGRALGPGRYVARLVARDKRKNRSKSHRVSFRISG